MRPNEWRRWDLVLLDFDPVTGSEQAGRRPALVVSNDGFNTHFPLVTLVPLTKREGKVRRAYDFEVLLPERVAGNPLESIVMPQQVRTVSTSRIVRRIGRLHDADLRAAIEDRLLDHLGIGFEDDVEP